MAPEGSCGPGNEKMGLCEIWLWEASGLLAGPGVLCCWGWWRQLFEKDDYRWKKGCNGISQGAQGRMRRCTGHSSGQQAPGKSEELQQGPAQCWVLKRISWRKAVITLSQAYSVLIRRKCVQTSTEEVKTAFVLWKQHIWQSCKYFKKVLTANLFLTILFCHK